MDNQNMPQRGTPEYDELMRQHYGNDYNIGFRVGFLYRFPAAIMDIFFITFLVVITGYFTGTLEALIELSQTLDFASIMESPEEAAFIDEISTKIALMSGFISVIYYSTEIFLAASPGKIILGLKIASADMTQATSAVLIRRFLIKHSSTILSLITTLMILNFFDFVSVIAAVIIFIGYFFMFGYTRQTLHDKLADTAIYRNQDINQAV